MTVTTVAILALTAVVAGANGANDSAKGVATLAGCGMVRYRTALAWGIASTLVGALASLTLASRISTLFTKGIVSAPPTTKFSLAVLAGTFGWVAFATAFRLPVSTTHAIVGSLVGTGLVLARGAIAWSSLIGKVVLPLLLSIVAAYAISAMLGRLARRTPRCVCVDVVTTASPAPEVNATSTAGAAALAYSAGGAAPLPTVQVLAGDSCPVHAPGRLRLRIEDAHWLTSGAIGFARGLNDTPKIWAIGAATLVPATVTRNQLLLVVALAMALGGAIAGMRIARQLGDNVIAMGDREGFTANLTAAGLVGVGANLGLPMSTTHVATGAIAGIAGSDTARLNRRVLANFGITWTVTPVVAGSVAAMVALLTR